MEIEPGASVLPNNLRELGLNPENHVSDKNFIVPGNDRYLNSRFVVALLSDSNYFVASDSYGTKAYASSTFTGIYSSVELPVEAECKILKKDWIDSVLYFRKKKTGIKFLDDKLTILSKGWLPSKELSVETVNLFLELNTKGNPYFLLIQQDYIPKIDSLKGKMIVGIETNQWIYEKEDLKWLLELGSKIINNFIKL